MPLQSFGLSVCNAIILVYGRFDMSNASVDSDNIYSKKVIPMPTYDGGAYNNTVREIGQNTEKFQDFSAIGNPVQQKSSKEILQTQIPAPILLDLGRNGGRIAFRSFEEALEWAENELETWRYIAISGTPAERSNYLQRIVEQQLSVPDSIAEKAIAAIEARISAQEAAVSIRNYLDAYAAFRCIHSSSTLGSMAKTMERHRSLVLGLLAGATDSAKPEAGRSFDKPADKESFIFGYALALQFKAEHMSTNFDDHVLHAEMRMEAVLDRLEPAERSLSTLHERYQALRGTMQGAVDSIDGLAENIEDQVSRIILSAKKELESSIQEMWARLSATEEEHARQMHLMRETLTAQMQVSSSVEYWSESSKYHSEKASGSMQWFIISGLVSIVVIAAVATGLFKSGIGQNVWISSLAMAMPMIVSFYMLDIFAKSRKEHERLANNAAERVAMLETFTALEFESRAEDTERVLMLNALFQPATTNPTNVEVKNNIADLLKQIKNKK